jgi:hypothetical protein
MRTRKGLQDLIVGTLLHDSLVSSDKAVEAANAVLDSLASEGNLTVKGTDDNLFMLYNFMSYCDDHKDKKSSMDPTEFICEFLVEYSKKESEDDG